MMKMLYLVITFSNIVADSLYTSLQHMYDSEKSCLAWKKKHLA